MTGQILTISFIGNTEVTQKQWYTVMDEISTYPKRELNANQKGDNKPMVEITWYDAVAFCNYLTKREYKNFDNAVYYVEINGVREYDPGNWGQVPALNNPTRPDARREWKAQVDPNGPSVNWTKIKMDETKLGYRLPKMDEWLYVARGGKEIKYPKYSGTSGETVNDLGKVAWYNGQGIHDVATKPENTSPVKDMTGNVWELCWGNGDYGDTMSKDGSYKTAPKLGGGAAASASLCDLSSTKNPPDWKDVGGSKRSNSADTGFRVVANQPK